MKKIKYILAALLVVITSAAQQTTRDILSQIEQNNTTLQALRETAGAEKLENRTGIYLDNPEVEFNYLWGSPSAIGNRKDVRVSQRFDIPTITGMKSQLAGEQNKLVDIQYKADRLTILLEARRNLVELAYYNRLLGEWQIRLDHARTLAEGYQRLFDEGDTNILEYNKIRLNLSAAEGEIARMQVERQAILSELTRLNGGKELVIDNNYTTDEILPLNFEEWYGQAEQQSPVLEYVNREIELAKKQITLNKAAGLPSLSTGYMREKVVGETYQGLTLGVSIPLWENKNRVKQARTALKAAEIRREDTRIQFYNRLRNQYQRAYGLQIAADNYRQSLINLNNVTLLKKALDAGQISLLEYMVEIGIYYDTITQALEAERDFGLAYAELSAVLL